MDDIVSVSGVIAHLNVWFFFVAVVVVLIFNLCTMPVRRTLFRFVGSSAGQFRSLMVNVAVYAVIPACVAGCLAVYLLPALMHAGHPLSINLLYHRLLPILRFAMIPASVAVLAVTVPYSRRFVCRHPAIVESISAVVCFVFFAHHALYSGYPSLVESSAGERIIPSLMIIFAVLLIVYPIFSFVAYLIDRSISRWYAPCHTLRKRVVPALCATLVQCVPLLLISQLVCYRFETAVDVDAVFSYKQASYSYYVELFMYAELYEMIDADSLGPQLVDAMISNRHKECRRYRTVTARAYNMPDHSPLEAPFSSNSWRNVALWYNRR